jgi:hypothetical protein
MEKVFLSQRKERRRKREKSSTRKNLAFEREAATRPLWV